MTNKILVIDDDKSISDALIMVLSEEGYNVSSVTNGELAYDRVKKIMPGLVFLDVLMSGIDGREICKQIKSDPKTKNIKVVMISAHPAAEKGSMESGADDFIAKPFETSELISVVKRNIKKR